MTVYPDKNVRFQKEETMNRFFILEVNIVFRYTASTRDDVEKQHVHYRTDKILWAKIRYVNI